MRPAGRLAPSPTGAQHLGNARTYLMAYWSARARDAELVLRIEDVDSPRVKSWAIEQAIEDLRWLGIDWDEGPDIGGPHGPYIQTERVERYRGALNQLIEDDRVFPCNCTRKDIQEAGSAPHFDHEGPIYPGTCAGWRQGDPLPPEGSYCWRFRTRDRFVEFEDIVLGRQHCNPQKDLGDFPVTQKSGEPSYQLAVVLDDAAMEIDEVVRGDDLVASTFRQIELYHAFGLAVPTFAHVPLVYGPDGRRLAKRHGDTRLSHYRDQGVPPRVIITWAAQSCGLIAVDQCLTTAEEFIGSFDWRELRPQEVKLPDVD